MISITFANLPNGYNPMSLFDQAFAEVGFSVSNIAGLRALNGQSAVGNAVSVVGYYSATLTSAPDGGGGVFIYDASDTTSADNGGTIIVDSIGRRWYRMYSGPLNALWFGAKGDGATDNTTIVNNLITYVSELGGGSIYFPPGGYIGNFILQAGVILTGNVGTDNHGYLASGSVRRTTFQGAPAVAGWVVTLPSGGCENAGVVGIDLEGLGSGVSLGGMHCTPGSSDCVAKAICFNNFANQGLLDEGVATTCADLLMTNCLLNRSPGAQVGALQIAGTDGYFYNCECSPSLSALASASLYICGIYITGTNNHVIACIGEYGDVGIWSGGDANILLGCRADHNYGPGVIVGGDLVGCKANDNSLSGDGAYSAFESLTVQAGQCVGCRAEVFGSVHHKYGFDFSAQIYLAVASRSSCVGCYSSGHSVAAYNQNITGGQTALPQSILVGTAMLTGTGDNPNMDQTTFYAPQDGSAQNLTTMSSLVMGQVYSIIGNSNITIKNDDPPSGGSPFINNGGSDISCTAGKIYQFLAIPYTGPVIALRELSGT